MIFKKFYKNIYSLNHGTTQEWKNSVVLSETTPHILELWNDNLKTSHDLVLVSLYLLSNCLDFARTLKNPKLLKFYKLR